MSYLKSASSLPSRRAELGQQHSLAQTIETAAASGVEFDNDKNQRRQSRIWLAWSGAPLDARRQGWDRHSISGSEFEGSLRPLPRASGFVDCPNDGEGTARPFVGICDDALRPYEPRSKEAGGWADCRKWCQIGDTAYRALKTRGDSGCK